MRTHHDTHPLRHDRNPSTWMPAPTGQQLDLMEELAQTIQQEDEERITRECAEQLPGQYWQVVVITRPIPGNPRARSCQFLRGFTSLGEPVLTSARHRARFYTSESAHAAYLTTGLGCVVRYDQPYFNSWEALESGIATHPALIKNPA